MTTHRFHICNSLSDTYQNKLYREIDSKNRFKKQNLKTNLKKHTLKMFIIFINTLYTQNIYS